MVGFDDGLGVGGAVGNGDGCIEERNDISDVTKLYENGSFNSRHRDLPVLLVKLAD